MRIGWLAVAVVAACVLVGRPADAAVGPAVRGGRCQRTVDCSGAPIALLSTALTAFYGAHGVSKGPAQVRPELHFAAVLVATTALSTGTWYAIRGREGAGLRWIIPIAAGAASVPAIVMAVYGLAVAEGPASPPAPSDPKRFVPWSTADFHLRLEAPLPTLLVDIAGQHAPGVLLLRAVF